MRGRGHLAGWLLKEDPQNPNQTIATIMLEMDTGLNNTIMGVAMKEQGQQLIALRSVIAKYLQENSCPY